MFHIKLQILCDQLKSTAHIHQQTLGEPLLVLCHVCTAFCLQPGSKHMLS